MPGERVQMRVLVAATIDTGSYRPGDVVDAPLAFVTMYEEIGFATRIAAAVTDAEAKTDGAGRQVTGQVNSGKLDRRRGV